jgi:hypothetical protein
MTESGKPAAAKSTNLVNWALALFVTVVALLLADGSFRYYERSRLLPRLPEAGGSGPVNLAALGYNDGLVGRAKADGEYRILSFGDSFTYSVMDPPWSYNGILQERLDESLEDRRVTVVNLGEPATGTRQFRAAYDFWSQVFEHDAVLFHLFLGNDILDDAYLHAAIDWQPNQAVLTSDHPILKAGNPRVPRKFPLRMMDYAYAWWMSEKTRSGEGLPQGYNWAALTSFDQETFRRINFKFLENFDPRKLDALLAGYEQVHQLLVRAREIRQAGTPVAVVLGPSQPQVDHGLLMDTLAAHGESVAHYDMGLAQRIVTRLRDRVAPGVPLIDLTAAFRERHATSGEKLYFRRNTHWDREGNRLAGETIAGRLLAHWFEQAPSAWHPEQLADMPLVSDARIDAYLAPLTGAGEPGRPQISGAVRAVQMMDGISDRTDNWAVAPLGQAIGIEFGEPVAKSLMRMHLFDAGGRQYGFRAEARVDGVWRMVADHTGEPVSGVQDVRLPEGGLTAVRITGTYSSAQETDPANAYLHVKELEFLD